MNKPRFLWGVATSGYQSEGGYNGPGQPLTNWAATEHSGEVAASGAASEFWTRYEADFDTCQRLGINAFRLGIEWSRVQPSTNTGEARTLPAFDDSALDQYAEMIAAARRRGLEPVVTLHHFVHPAWLGTDPWLAGRLTIERFAEYVRTVVGHINHRLVTHHGVEAIRYYITVNEPNMLVINSYIAPLLPVGADAPRGFEPMVRAYDALLAAHVTAYNLIHDLHSENGWGDPLVSLNTYCSDVYWLDKLLLDLLCLRERGVADGTESAYLRGKAGEFQRALTGARIPFRRDVAFVIGSAARKIANWLGTRVFKEVRLPLGLAAIRSSPREVLLDYVALDYYDPFFAHLARLPAWRDLESKAMSPQAFLMASVTSKWWDWRVLPDGLDFFCRYYSADLGNKPLLIAENGMAIRCTADHKGYARRDGVSRSEFLRRHVDAAVRIAQSGAPLFGYLHWSLFDNYEWGSFTPRFGLYALDYREGSERLPTDCTGDPAAETYAVLIKEARITMGERPPLDANRFSDDLRQISA